jgi:pyruvate kinase
VNLPTVTEKDKHDIVQFAARMRLDMIAASFVQEGDDIDTIRGLLGPLGRMIKIIAKIENQEGLLNYDDILAKADGIMVARGDLGMEIPPEKVFMAQKMMIRKANLVGKPVITATQMLESMVKNPRPTRAECTDVANAVLDGTDCVMLSGETAGGQYPLEAVRMMSKVCMEAESIINYRQLYDAIRSSTLDELGEEMGTPEAIASAAVKTCIDMGAKALVVCSETGNSARHIAKYRPSVPILVLTATPEVARQVSGLSRGTVSMVMGSMIGTDSLLTHAAGVCKERGWAAQGDTIVAVHGMLEGKPGSTNLLKVLPVL